jgi:hypothetical protein
VEFTVHVLDLIAIQRWLRGQLTLGRTPEEAADQLPETYWPAGWDEAARQRAAGAILGLARDLLAETEA